MSDLEKRIAALSPEKRELLLRQLAQKKQKKPKAFPEIPCCSRDQKVFPLSFSQQRLWFLEKLEPGLSTYHIPGALRIEGELKYDDLKRSLEYLGERHESLRLHFPPSEEEPSQAIQETIAIDLEYIDLSHLSFENKELIRSGQIQVSAFVEKIKEPFDLENGPLFRTTLFSLGQDEYLFLLVIHHIISDAWSMGVMVKEIAEIYTAFQRKQNPALAPLRVHYVDFAFWQKQWLNEERQEKLLDYWRHQLQDPPPPLSLPYDFFRPKRQTFQGNQQSFQIPSSLLAKLKKIAQEEEATLFMILVSTFQLLLSRYSGQEDVLIGTPSANRPRKELEALIGFFVNTLVLRSQCSGNMTWLEFLAQVKETTLAAYSHQDIPFEKLVEETQPTRDLSRSPLFQVLFAWQNVPSQILSLPSLKWSSLPLEKETAKFDLSVYLSEKDNQVQGIWEYNTDLFRPATIIQMSEHYHALLESITKNPHQKLVEINMITLNEKQMEEAREIHSQRDYENVGTLKNWLEKQARTTPKNLALVSEGFQMTYAQLHTKSNQWAHYLHSCGLERDEVVGVCLKRSPEMVLAILAIVKAGGAYLPIDPTLPKKRKAFMLEDAGTRFVISKKEKEEEDTSWIESKIKLLLCDKISLEESSGENLVLDLSPENLAYVIYTSGSTGLPKGVMVPHRGIVNRLQWMQEAYSLDKNDRVLQKTPFSFDVSVWEFFWPLLTGACLVVAPPKSHQDSAWLKRIVLENQITILHFVPSMLDVFLQEPDLAEHCSSLRQVICSGEALSLSVSQGFYKQELSAHLHNLYGPTEASVDVTFWPCQKEERGTHVPIGFPIANTQIHVLDQNLRPVATGVVGELYIAGVGLARGYLKRADLSAEKFLPNPFSKQPGSRLYRSGDLARYDDQGKIEYVGRVDDQVKIRGFRIELGEIEATLQDHTEISQAKVIVQTKAQEKFLVAYLLSKQSDLDTQEIHDYCTKKLPPAMIPSAFIVLAQFPLTRHGKIDWKALPQPKKMGLDLKKQFIAAQTPLQESLVTIWEELLDRHPIGIVDDFFQLGGHSLLAIKLVSRLNQSLEIDLPLRTIFERTNIEKLAQELEEILSKANPKISPITRTALQESYPLSFAQHRLWFLDQLQPGSPAYNIPMALRLRGKLQVEIMEQSLNQVIEKQDIFASRFFSEGGQPRQRVEEFSYQKFIFIDLRNFPLAQRNEKAQHYIRQESQKPFNLAQENLWRMSVLQVEEDEYILLFLTHHIVFDGSVEIFLEQLVKTYQAKISGEDFSGPQLKVSYRDYAVWQRELLEGEILAEQMEYWKKKLGGELPVLQLPTDRPRPNIYSFKGSRFAFELPLDLTEKLKDLSQREGSTLFMTLLAAFSTLLHRYSEQEDIVVGTPINNRNREEIRDLVGCFVNTLALRADLSKNPSFSNLLEQVRTTTLDAYSHQDVPFEMLVEKLQPKRSLSHTPIFQSMLVVQHVSMEKLALPDLEVEALEAHSERTRFDLLLSLNENSQGMTARLEYNTDLFDLSTIERFVQSFQNLLYSIVENPQITVKELSLLSSSQKQELVYEWNRTGSFYRQNLRLENLFEEQVQKTPDLPAVIFQNDTWSYQEINSQANQVAHLLKTQGVKRGDWVGVFLDRSMIMIPALLGIFKAGAAYLPLNASLPELRLKVILESLQVYSVITEKKLMPSLLSLKPELPSLEHIFSWDEEEEKTVEGLHISNTSDWKKQSTENLSSIGSSQDRAYVIFTSGSTGQPKGVIVNHRAVLNLIDWANPHFSLNEKDRGLFITSLSFDLSVYDVFGLLATGASIRLASSEETESPQKLCQVLCQENITFWNSAPQALQQLVPFFTKENLPHSSLRLVFLSGDWIPVSLPDQVRRVFPQAKVISLGGATEATVWSNYYPIEEVSPSWSSIPYGKPISNAQYYILNSELSPCPVGVPGDLYIAGDCLAEGYHDPLLTAERFLPNPFSVKPGERIYKTGDRACYWPDGNMEFLGRNDYQVKIRGFRVELGEIEVHLSQHAQIKECVVTTEERAGQKRLVAYLVHTDNIVINNSDLQDFLKAKLPEYMVPDTYILLNNLPLTANGKLNYAALPKAEASEAQEREFLEPENETEEVLLEIWQELLGEEEISTNDNFFAQGGHSLLATQMISRLEECFEISVSLRSVFENPTISLLALEVERILIEELDKFEDEDE